MRIILSVFYAMILNTIVLVPVYGWSEHMSVGLGHTTLNNRIPVTYTQIIPTPAPATFLVQNSTNTLSKNAPHFSIGYSLSKYINPWFLTLESTILIQQLNTFEQTTNWKPTGPNGLINPALSTKTHGILSFSVAPAIKITPWVQLFARLGPAFTVFHSSSKQGTLGSGGLLGYSGSFTKIIPGITRGVGLRINLEPRWNLQVDYSHLHFIHFSKYGIEPGNNAPLTQNAYTASRYHLSAHLLTLNCLYDF
jgi:hypothetical protein